MLVVSPALGSALPEADIAPCALATLPMEPAFLFAGMLACDALFELPFCDVVVPADVALARLLCSTAPLAGKIIFGKTAAAEPAPAPEPEKKTSKGVCVPSFEEPLVFAVAAATDVEVALALRRFGLEASMLVLAEPERTDGLAAAEFIGATALWTLARREAASLPGNADAESTNARFVSPLCSRATSAVALPDSARFAGSRKDEAANPGTAAGVKAGTAKFGASICAI
jgi:hypothetical protein